MQQNTNEQTLETKARKPYIAFLLALLMPGLGQLYNGQPKKAGVFLGLFLAMPLLFGLTPFMKLFYGLVAVSLIELSIRIYGIIDAIRQAKHQPEYTLKPYNTWYYYLIIMIIGHFVIQAYDVVSVVGLQTFELPVKSNSPTLQEGDLLVADMRAYQNKAPDYGDLVTFQHTNGEIYIFRVVGLPNDEISLKNDILTINGRPNPTRFIRETKIDTEWGQVAEVLEFEEELPNGHTHVTWQYKRGDFSPPYAEFDKINIPPDNYFLMGDFRDQATDSRYDGFVSREQITGRVIYSYWGKSLDRINIDFRNQ